MTLCGVPRISHLKTLYLLDIELCIVDRKGFIFCIPLILQISKLSLGQLE